MTESSKALYVQVVNQLIPEYREDEARQLAKILFHYHLGLSFEDIMIEKSVTMDRKSMEVLDHQVSRLKALEPIQYVLGLAHFYNRDFFVNPSVLIPRQETEELIREILVDNNREGLSILDIGAGSGCIGITLGLELKQASIAALDISGAALDVTMKNAKQFGLEVSCHLDNVLELDALPAKYDIIVSNPPYVTESEKELMHENVLKHEPGLALFVPDDDPLLFYKKIIALSKTALNPKGRLYLEINEQFGMDMIRLCESSGCACVRMHQDLNGKDRFIKTMFD